MDTIVRFLVKNIKSGIVTYEAVVAARPDLKEKIDGYVAVA